MTLRMENGGRGGRGVGGWGERKDQESNDFEDHERSKGVPTKQKESLHL